MLRPPGGAVKRAWLIAVMSMAAVTARPQSMENVFCTDDVPAGRYLTSQKEVLSTRFTCSRTISGLYVDSLTGNATILLKGGNVFDTQSNRAEIICYDPKEHKSLWSVIVDYDANEFTQRDSLMIVSDKNMSHMLDPHSGKTVWSRAGIIKAFDRELRTGIMFAEGHNSVSGVDLTNGNLLWKSGIIAGAQYGSDIMADDSTLVIMSEYLHCFDIKTGKEWTCKAMASIVTADSAYLYMASKSEMAKIEKSTGKLVWSRSLRNRPGSRSSIFTYGGLVGLVNSGYTYNPGERSNYGYILNEGARVSAGVPFVVFFDAATGDEVHYYPLGRTGEYIEGFERKDGDMLFGFMDRLVVVPLTARGEPLKKSFDRKRTGKLVGIAGDHIFLRVENDTMTSLNSDKTKHFFITDKKAVIVTDGELNIVGYIPLEKLYIKTVSSSGGLDFFEGRGKTVVAGAGSRVVAEIDITGGRYIAGNNIYFVNGSIISQINLDHLVAEMPR